MLTRITSWVAGLVIPPWMLYAACVVLGVAGAWTAQDWRYGEKISEMQRENAKSVLAFQQAARAKETEWNNRLQEAQDAHQKREIELRRDADNARGAVDGVRGQLVEIRRQLPSLAEAACRERADTLADVLGQCVGQYQGLAEATDRHVNDKQTLIDAWPK